MVNRGDVRYQIKYEILSLKDNQRDNTLVEAERSGSWI